MTHNHEIINFKEAFTYGWTMTKTHWLFLFLISLISFAVMIPFDIIDTVWNEYSYFSTNSEMLLYIAFMLIYWVLNLTLMFNTVKIQLDLLHEKKVELEDLFKLPTMQTVKYFATCILLLIMVIAGLIAFVIPGIYFGLKYGFAPTLVLDKKMGILEAGEMSAKMMKGEMWQMFAFVLVMAICLVGIVIAGLLCFIIGVIPAIFIAGWIGTFANLLVYKKLVQHKL